MHTQATRENVGKKCVIERITGAFDDARITGIGKPREYFDLYTGEYYRTRPYIVMTIHGEKDYVHPDNMHIQQEN